MGGERRFLRAVILQIGTVSLSALDQTVIDKAAMAICPGLTPASRNRHVYTPVSAVLRHAGVSLPIKRPQGAQGNRRDFWFRPDEADKLLDAAWKLHPRFGALCTFLLYTGCRLSEALRLVPRDCDLDAGYAEIGETKTGEARGVHLPPIVMAAIRRCLMERINPSYAVRTEPRTDGTVFALSQSGHLYELLNQAEGASGVAIPSGVSFHAFRHTYGAWMRRYGRVQLHETGAWSSRAGAKPYDHYDVSNAARAADRLPGADQGAEPDLKVVGDGK